MLGRKSFIENRYPGFYTDKYGIPINAYKAVIPVFTANERWPVIRYVCVLLCCQ